MTQDPESPMRHAICHASACGNMRRDDKSSDTEDS
jgi:hypothetical protein